MYAPPQQQWNQPHGGPQWNDQPPVHVPQSAGGIVNQNQASFFTKVFGWMAMGLGLTAAVSYGTFHTGLWLSVAPYAMYLMFAELGMVFYLSSRLSKMKPGTAIGMFLGYAALNGLTLSVIFAIYQLGSIALTFVGAASMFGFMFVLGLVTKKDLAPMGRFLYMALFGIIIMTLLNWFGSWMGWLGQGTQMMISLAISYVGVLVFAGLTAWDAQKLKRMSANGFRSDADETRMSILGALTLYLDFINLFLFLLRIFGGRRN
jgi:hypothetical protein